MNDQEAGTETSSAATPTAAAIAAECVSKALRHHEDGDIPEAREAYVAALAAQPDHPMALRLLACLEASAGRVNVAGALFRRVAEDDPGNVSHWLNLGVQLRKFGLFEDAVRCFDQALDLRADLLQVLRHKADTLSIMDDSERARDAWAALLEGCDRAAERGDDDTACMFFRGLSLLHLRRTGEAVEVFLGLMRHEEAREGHPRLACAAAIARSMIDGPSPGEAMVHRALDLVEMVCHFRQIAAASTTPVSALNILGLTLAASGSLDESIACFEEIASLQDAAWQPRVQVAHCLLMRGDFDTGWAEYEARLARPRVPWDQRDFQCPSWDGVAPVAGRKVRVWAEQGLGDALQFSRYASHLADRGAQVSLEVHAPLVRLLRGLRGVHEVLAHGTAAADADFHCALMSLPHLLRSRLEGDTAAGYLAADPSDVAAWASRVPRGFNVGIAWTGNPAHSNDFRRSLPLRKVLAHLPPDVRWWCVQKDVRERDASLLAGAGIERPALGDMADTAALMANLDAVVSVDTSVAHLAGSLGRPTLLLLPHSAEWRWQQARTDTPWYGSMRLVRQDFPGDWDGSLRVMAGLIHEMASRTHR